jgi:hypothetical protein
MMLNKEMRDHDPIDLVDDDLISLFEHDLFGKPVRTFPDHALAPSFSRHQVVSFRDNLNIFLEYILREKKPGSEEPGLKVFGHVRPTQSPSKKDY